MNHREKLQKYISEFWQLQLVYVAARLGIADVLRSGPKHSEELAYDFKVNTTALHRVLRAMVVIGLLTEEGDGRFGLTPMGELLQSHRSDSMRGEVIIVGHMLPAWNALLHSVQTGKIAFDHVFGMGLFTYLVQNSEIGQYFNQLMAHSTNKIAAAAVAAYDFSTFQRIVDVGGGYGTLLRAILSTNSVIRGVLFDLLPVIEKTRKSFESSGLLERCEFIPGDFFEFVPGGGDVYALQFTVHDWDDEQANQILKNCRRAMTGQGKLLVVERLMPRYVNQSPTTIQLDLSMLVMTGGRERTGEDYSNLFAGAGFQLTKIIPTQGPWSVIEGIPIGAP